MSESHGIEVRAEHLHKTYITGPEHVAVLRNVSFTIQPGERVAIVGRSGAGKSTLLHILGTLDTPTSGSVFYGGDDVFAKGTNLARFRNQKLGFIFQFHHLLPEFTALENVMMPAIVRRRPCAEAEAQARKFLEQVGLGERVEHKPGELSGGERQRVAVARAIMTGPSVILADEPTGNLDRGTSDGIHELLEELNRSLGITLIIVTHDLRLAARMDRQLRLVDGKAVEEKPGQGVSSSEMADVPAREAS